MTRAQNVVAIFFTLAGAMTSLYIGSFIAVAADFHRVWFPSFLLFLFAVILSRTSFLESDVRNFKKVEHGLLIAPAATAAAFISATLSSYLVPASPDLIKLIEYLRPRTGIDLFYAVFLSMTVVAVGEEMVFRGVIHRRFRNLVGKNKAILLSSIVFAAAHFDFSRFLPTFVIGLFTAYSLERTGSLAPPIIIHGINNSAYFALLFLSPAAFAAEKLAFP